MTTELRVVSGDGLWDIPRACKWLSLTEQAFRTMLRRNQIPEEAIVRIGRRIRLRSDVIRAWVKGGEPA